MFILNYNLNKREAEIIKLIDIGYSRDMICSKLNISIYKYNKYIRNIKKKIIKTRECL